MCHGPQSRRLHERAKADAVGGEAFEEIGAGDAGGGDVEHNDVRFDRGDVDGDALDFGQALRQRLGLGVVVGEAIDVVLQGIDAGRRDDAGLAHSAAEQVLETPGLGNELLVAGQDAADGATESLREIDPTGIEVLAVVARGDTGCDDGVEESRPVKVHEEAVLASDGGDLFNRLHWPDATAAKIVGVLDADESCMWEVRIVGADQGLDLRSGEDAVVGVDGADRCAAVNGRAAAFKVDRVAGRFDDDLVTGSAVDGVGDQIAHRAGREEEGGLLAGEVGDHVLKAVDAGVFAFLLITDFGVGDGLAHAGGGAGLGVAGEVVGELGHGGCSRVKRGIITGRAVQGFVPPASVGMKTTG